MSGCEWGRQQRCGQGRVVGDAGANTGNSVEGGHSCGLRVSEERHKTV